MRQLVLDIRLVSRPSLERFYPASGCIAKDVLEQWVESSADACSNVPVYLWGPAGSGKTHLLESARAALQARGAQVGWMDASSAPVPVFDERWLAVVMDDVHAYDAARQQAAFSWFVQASTAQRRVLAAGECAPIHLPLREDLRTRLGWGQVCALPLLDEAGRRDVLRKAAHERGIVLGEDVMDFMLRRFSRDLGSLVDLLDRLDAYALQTQRVITIPLLKDMLAAD